MIGTVLNKVLGLDLRSLALFRIGLAGIVALDLLARARYLAEHYSDWGVLPRSLLAQMVNPWYWSFHRLGGGEAFQGILFAIALLFALAMLVGYRTRLATIAVWAMTVSLHNRNPFVLFAGDDVLRAVLFWAMFLPLGASYSIDSALNNSPDPLPKRVASGATFAFMVQICFIYIWSAAYKTKSPIWFPDGDAVYYALSFDQYATPFGQLLLGLPQSLQKILTFGALGFEWLGPLLIFIPIFNDFFRWLAIISFILLHLGFGLSFEIGMFSYLSVVNWLAFIPTSFWEAISRKLQTPARQGTIVNYDADCGFCKKVAYILRVLLILPEVSIRKAQDDLEIEAAMLAQNSWVVVDWKGKHHYKFEAIAYIVGISPLFWWLEPILRWKPVMAAGTRFYETIANNRKTAGILTRPLKFRPLSVRPSFWFNFATSGILLLTAMWNLKGFADQTVIRRSEPKADWIAQTQHFFTRRTLQALHPLGYLTRLDQSWSIFAPNPPRDDGWYVIPGRLRGGSEVNLLDGDRPLSEGKPTIAERDRLYPTMQWRTYFINLNRAVGKSLLPAYADYLCRRWNERHSGSQALEQVEVIFIDETTVPPGQVQGIERKSVLTHSCNLPPQS